MPTNKQRREAARRHLERQLQRRIETDVKRKRRNLIVTIVASVVVVAVVVVVSVFIVRDNKKSNAAATPTDSTSAAPTSPAAPVAATSGPCGYSQSAQPATKDVGVPPDPSPTPTINRTMTLTSNQGPITITLDATLAPCTVQSIAYLANKGLYDGTSCFRLVTSGIYVLQCGDPANNGTGGPGYQVKDENLDKVDYTQVGAVAMANGGPGTDGSQFFIIYKDSSGNLGKNYTQIGKVTTGLDIIQKVAAAGEDDANGAGDGKPKLPISFTTVTVAPPVDGSGTLVTPSPTAPAASTPAAGAPAASTPAPSPSK